LSRDIIRDEVSNRWNPQKRISFWLVRNLLKEDSREDGITRHEERRIVAGALHPGILDD
jgi:hypothetical protein